MARYCFKFQADVEGYAPGWDSRPRTAPAADVYEDSRTYGTEAAAKEAAELWFHQYIDDEQPVEWLDNDAHPVGGILTVGKK